MGVGRRSVRLLGVGHVLNKPVRARLLNNLLERFWPVEQPAAPERSAPTRAPVEITPPEPIRQSQKSLEVLRSFSALLPHSLSVDAILKQFLMLLRETVAVNRAAIFLRPSPEAVGSAKPADGERHLNLACASGVLADLRQHFFADDSMQARAGRFIARDASSAGIPKKLPAIPKPAESLTRWALKSVLPILDREMLMGVAFFDRRVTGELLSNEELSLIFYMLEGLGMAIRNIWLHEEVAANQDMMGDVLRQLHSGCVVVGRDLSIQHANKVARQCFIPE